MPAQVFIVEDEPELLRGLELALCADPQLHLWGTATTLTEARQALQRSPPPDVLLLDLGLPDGSGVALIREVRERYPGMECMVVTIFADDAHLLASIEAGATGYLLKDASPSQVSARIHELLAGGAPMSPSIARRILGRLRPLPAEGMGPGAVAAPPGGR
ncbi:MAG: response regulator transcription factor [Tepidimonas sp.]